MSPRNPKLNGGFHGNIIENGGFTIVMFGKWRVIGLMYPLIRCSISKEYNLCVHGIQWISKTNNHIYGAPHRSTVINPVMSQAYIRLGHMVRLGVEKKSVTAFSERTM